MSKQVQDYRDLVVWKKGIALAKIVYRITNSFPSAEKFGLVNQMRRAAISISHAEGSAAELDTQLILSVELGFCEESDAAAGFELISELRRMMNALRRTLMPRR